MFKECSLERGMGDILSARYRESGGDREIMVERVASNDDVRRERK